MLLRRDLWAAPTIMPKRSPSRHAGGRLRAGLWLWLLGPALLLAAGTGEEFAGESAGWRRYQSPHFELFSANADGQSRELLHEIAAVGESSERIGVAGHLEPAVRVLEIAIALREFEGAVTDLFLELYVIFGGTRDAPLLRVPDRQQNQCCEQEVAKVRPARKPG